MDFFALDEPIGAGETPVYENMSSTAVAKVFEHQSPLLSSGCL